MIGSSTSQTIVPVWGTAQKIFSGYLLFHLFTTFSPFPHGPKSTRLKKIHISTRNLSEGNLFPRWRNTLVNILLDTMDDSTVCFTIITNNTSSNPSPHMVVTFLLVLLHWQEKYQKREMKRVQTSAKKMQAQNKK